MSTSRALEERFKAVSSTHRLLVVTCFALIVCALTTDYYAQAINEAQALERMRNSLAEFVADGKAAPLPMGKIDNIWTNSLRGDLMAAVSDVKPLTCKTCESNPSERYAVAINSQRIDKLKKNDTVTAFREFLVENAGYQMAVPLGESLRPLLRDALRRDQAAGKLPKDPANVAVSFAVLPLKYADASSEEPTAGATVVVKLADHEDILDVVTLGDVPCRVDPVEGTRIQDWLGKKGLWKSLVNAEDLSDILPGLSRFWDLVGDKRLRNAQKILENKQRDDQQNVELLGLKISGEKVVIVAPLAIAFLLSYLAVHLWSISRAIGGPERPSVDAYGWVCAYEGWWVPWLLAPLSLVALPLVCETGLLAKLATITSAYLRTGLAIALFNLMLGIVACYYTHLLQPTRHQPAAYPEVHTISETEQTPRRRWLRRVKYGLRRPSTHGSCGDAIPRGLPKRRPAM